MPELAPHEHAGQERRLTVSRLFARRAEPRAYNAPDATVPFLRISGRWLERLGFAPGDRVRVEAECGKLLVTRIQPSAEAR